MDNEEGGQLLLMENDKMLRGIGLRQAGREKVSDLPLVFLKAGKKKDF